MNFSPKANIHKNLIIIFFSYKIFLKKQYLRTFYFTFCPGIFRKTSPSENLQKMFRET